MIHVELDHDLAAAVARQGGTRASRALAAAVARTERMLVFVIETCGGAQPTADVIRFVAPGSSGAGAPVDPAGLAALTEPEQASVLLAAALNQVAATMVTTRGQRSPQQRRLSYHDQGHALAGGEWAGSDESELLLYYHSHHDFLRADQRGAVDETAEVEDRIATAVAGINGAAIIDKSGWQWRVRIP